MPHYLAIGVSQKDFWHSTLVDLRVYDDAYALKRRLQDERDYMCGLYTFEAVSKAIGNAFRKKGAKPLEFREKSFLAEIDERKHMENLTEREKSEYRNSLFSMLASMQEKFESNPPSE